MYLGWKVHAFSAWEKRDVFGNPMANQGSKIANYPRSAVRRASPGVEGRVKQRFLEGLSVWHWFLFGVLSVFVGFTATLKEFTCIYR